MATFLVQVSGNSVREQADPGYVAGTEGRTFADEPLRYGEYYNASPYWRNEGFGRRAAWRSVSSGDSVLLYCTSNVPDHGASLSHVLTVDAVSVSEESGARLQFGEIQELVPNVERSKIQREVDAGRFSEKMAYCGQQGFNFTEVEDRDLERATELANLFDPL